MATARHFVLDRVARALLAGHILRADDVTAGKGKVIDWATTKSGDELLTGADAFDVARLFVELVGEQAAIESVGSEQQMQEAV